MVELRFLFGGRIGDAVGAGKRAEKVIEAAVLGIDHDDRLDPGEAVLRLRRSEAPQQAGKGQPDALGVHHQSLTGKSGKHARD